eukprot:scaffold37465_cov444-Skeletonema_dohrnii-CCMP3373.AAC.1
MMIYMMCSADDESLLLAADLEVEVLKKLKLAIFGVQAKSDPSTTFFPIQEKAERCGRPVLHPAEYWINPP